MFKKNQIIKPLKEDAPAMSVAGGSVPSLTSPEAQYALQLKRKIKKKILKR
jgi:hypothetical protein